MIRLPHLSWGRTQEPRSALGDATLSCPLRGSAVDIEKCFTCGNLLMLANTDRPSVTCVLFGRDHRLTHILS